MKAIKSFKRDTSAKCVDCPKLIAGGEHRYYARQDGWGRDMFYCLSCGGKR